MTIEDGRIIIDLTGSLVTFLILGFWVLLGWGQGFRYILTIAIFVTLGYLLTVRADVIVTFVNGLYSFVIRFFNFISPNIAAIFPTPPIIPANAEAPLLLRVVVFVLLLAIGVGWKGPWETTLKGWQGYQQARLLGAITGLYVGLLVISATAVFWNAAAPLIAGRNTLTAVLDSLDTYEAVVPVFLASFIFLLMIVAFVTFLRGLQAPAPPAKK